MGEFYRREKPAIITFLIIESLCIFGIGIVLGWWHV